MKKKKYLLRVLIIVFLLLTATSVKAAEKYIDQEGKAIECRTKYKKLDHIKEQDFKIAVVTRSNSKYEFFLNPEDIVKDVPVTFACYDITNGQRVLQGQAKQLVGHSGGFYLQTAKDRSYECEATAKLSYDVKDSNGEPILDSKGNKQECFASFSQTFSFDGYGDEENVGIKNCQGIIDNIAVANNTSPINCNLYQSDAFNREFCEAKNNSSKKINFETNKTFKNKFPNFNKDSDNTAANGSSHGDAFKCDVTKQSSSGAYYVNKKYLFGYGNRTENAGYYKYHYDSPNKDYIDGNAVTCEIKCEEGVTVEYGSPVASKAGMCFTYQVKVTSRVSCYMAKEPKKPDIFSGYCEPVPRCYHGSTLYMQGGPDEEFDSCIKKCDGGKYTSKCSKKCYNKVYGKTKIEKSNTKNDNTPTVQKLDISECTLKEKPKFTCYYARGEGGSIKWECPNGFDCSREKQSIYEGRWYNRNWQGANGSRKEQYSLCGGHNDGIYRRILGGGNYCSDSCSWYAPLPGTPGSICTTPYLNPGLAEYDNYQNMQVYKQAINACKAKATCTTTVTYFRISAGYSKYSDNSYTEINFPYSGIKGKEKDRLASGENRTFNNIGSNNTTLIIGKTPAERAKSGCYAPLDEVTQKNLYKAEWTFPGTWINNKTGEISYVYKNEGWTQMKKSFCTPLDAKNVNQKWWNWYMKKALSGQSTSIESDRYKQECGPYETSNSITKVNSVSASDVERWNINAITTDFGYFKWGIHIQCFYALNTNPAMVSSSNSSEEAEKCCPAGGCGNNDNPQGSYRIRSVDLDNMFPDPNGKQTPVTEAGRPAGFNWSENAANIMNSENYKSNPQKYMMKVQELGNSVYDDTYLDYYFELDNQKLKKLQEVETYGEFKGETAKRKNTGITTYYSNVIREYTNQAPQKGPATECNNLENWKSTKCYVPE